MKITKTLFIAAASVGLTGFASATTINWNNNYRVGAGGEFTLVDSGLDLSAYSATQTATLGQTSGIIGANSFQTFCIEYNEHISKGQTVTIQGINSSANNGGVSVGGDGTPDFGGGTGLDPVSLGTAYLYSQFALGSLAGYDYEPAPTGTRKTSAGELQNAIWYLENEITLDTSLNRYLNGGSESVQSALGVTLAQAMAMSNGAYMVSAVNLLDSNNNKLQDQLYVGTGALAVPDGGASLMLLGMALAGIGVLRRFSAKKA